MRPGGWSYTYNSRGLGRTAGFLTGWMMVFGYAMIVPGGVALTSAYASILLADEGHVTIAPWVLFPVILAAVALLAYLGIRISSSADLLLVAGEMAVIAALAITILVKIGPAHYSAAVFSPASAPSGEFSDFTNAMIYGITAFAGFEAAAALGEEAKNTRRSVPASIIGVVLVTGVFYLLVVLAETFAVGRHGIVGLIGQPSRVLFAMGRERALPRSLARLSGRQTPVVAIGFLTVVTLALGLPLTYADGGGPTAGYLFAAGGLAVVLVYLTGNLAVIRAFRTEFRDEFNAVRHLLIPAVAAVIFLFPLWGIIRPPAYTLVNLLPFVALGWLALGIIVVGVLRVRQPASFQTLGKVFIPGE